MLFAIAASLALASPAEGQIADEQQVIIVDAPVTDSEKARALEANDPAELINLGVAYARQGDAEEARAMFKAVMIDADRLVLETVEGKWKDSRHLAHLGLKMLDRGDFRRERVAVR